MEKLYVKPIGEISADEEGMYIQLKKEFLPCLKGLEGFGAIQVIWWFSDFDEEEYRSVLECPSPYKNGPEIMGIFATRSPIRPNPVAITASDITGIEWENGKIHLAYIDANPGTPVLDLKPYTPSIDRIEYPQVPGWCSHWPDSVESSGDFNWEAEFNRAAIPISE
ncbi:SAM-dependent methyltransferase [Diplocloster modestus]|uniref:SAM-dependent methyltransferase n=1 Tax=Diplocloster modestus TaxID=2850322 RepID=A0ABS6K7L3_9FIRM|nr:SAM-dependent methyltransferase [Diplocloster modestus]MBU9726515.1 SAM-dependent methyltransferase [Diplocloster modestus]